MTTFNLMKTIKKPTFKTSKQCWELQSEVVVHKNQLTFFKLYIRTISNKLNNLSLENSVKSIGLTSSSYSFSYGPFNNNSSTHTTHAPICSVCIYYKCVILGITCWLIIFITIYKIMSVVDVQVQFTLKFLHTS